MRWASWARDLPIPGRRDPATGPSTASAAVPPGPGEGPPLTADLARTVRFNVAQPHGYYFPQVEEFVGQVTAALAWWEEQGRRTAQAMHDLQIELDMQVGDVQRLRTEIELFKVQGSALVNADGSYVTESQAAGDALAAAHQRIADLELEVRRLTSELAAAGEPARAAAPAEQEPTTPPPPAVSPVVAAWATADDSPPPPPVPPVDSELPPGATLPPQSTASGAYPDYPPAAPGLPLSTPGVPLAEWAPELAEGAATPADARPDHPDDPDAIPTPTLHRPA